MMIYEAVVHILGAQGERQVAIADFFLLSMPFCDSR